MRERMNTAADLIRAHQYDEARAILKTIDHPKAREWQARIEALYPTMPTPRKKWTPWRTYGLLAACILILVVIVSLYSRHVQERVIDSYEIEARVALDLFCMNTTVSDLRCEAWKRDVVRDHRDELISIALCGRVDGLGITENAARHFANCLIWDDIPLPF